eukprot:1136946-Pelagomonas_calceolata.AAC.2
MVEICNEPCHRLLQEKGHSRLALLSEYFQPKRSLALEQRLAEPDETEGERTVTAGTTSKPATPLTCAASNLRLLKCTQDLQQLGLRLSFIWQDEDEEKMGQHAAQVLEEGSQALRTMQNRIRYTKGSNC